MPYYSSSSLQTNRFTNRFFNITYMPNHPSVDNMDEEQFDTLLAELQALRAEIKRFNDRFELVSSRAHEHAQGWINEMDLSRPPR
jgi:hypothetical protein